jgi:protein-disulfide isomerase
VENEPRLIETYIRPGKVRLVYRHLLQLGDGSLQAAQANECAGDQGKFWEMRALLYQRQNEVYANIDGAIQQFAGELKLDSSSFGQCLTSNKYSAAIQADFTAATNAGVRARPVFEINGTRLVGFQPWEKFRELIETALK